MMPLPRHEYKSQQDDGLTIAEFLDYLDTLAKVHEDTALDFSKPTFTHLDIAAMIRNFAKVLRAWGK